MNTILMMSEQEARQKHGQLKNLEQVMGAIFLEMRDREGFKALGYGTFIEYGKAEWGYSASQTYRIAQAAEIQLSLNSPIGELKETQLRPLAKIPEDQRQTVLDNALATIEQSGGKLTAQLIRDHVEQHIQRAEQAEQKLKQTEAEIDQLAEQKTAPLLEQKTAEIQQDLQQQVEQLVHQAEQDYQARIEDKDNTIMRLRGDLTQLEKAAQSTELKAEKDRLLQEIEQAKAVKQQIQTEQHLELIQLGLRSTATTLNQDFDAIKNLIDGIQNQPHGEIVTQLKAALTSAESLAYFIKKSIPKFAG